MALVDLSKLLSGAVALFLCKYALLSCLQVRTNDGPESAQNSLSDDELVAEFALALLVQQMQAGKRLPYFFVRRSFVFGWRLVLEGKWEPEDKEFL